MRLDLTSPLTLRSGLVLPNRVAKSAMTEALADGSRLPSPALLRLYQRWATSGAGLLVTGNVGIDADHPVRPGDVIVGRGQDAAPFERWARVSRSGGARVVMQLNHAGRQTPRVVNPRPLGPSAGAAVKVMHAFGEPREATDAELLDIVRRHGEAAAIAERCGFDGAQVHAAHGYLLNQFLAPDVNRRDDAWGGDVRRRARLLIECVRAVRSATSARFAVTVKLNAADFLHGGFDEQDSLEVVALLDAERVDLLEISGGRYESKASFGHATPNAGAREAYFLEFARRAREATSAPLMLTGGLRTRPAMESALREGTLDVVGIARPMALAPDYPRRLIEGAPLPDVASRRLGVERLEGAAELAWWSAQLRRMSRGLDPDPGASPARALAAYMAADAALGLRARLLGRWGRRRALPPPRDGGDRDRDAGTSLSAPPRSDRLCAPK